MKAVSLCAGALPLSYPRVVRDNRMANRPPGGRRISRSRSFRSHAPGLEARLPVVPHGGGGCPRSPTVSGTLVSWTNMPDVCRETAEGQSASGCPSPRRAALASPKAADHEPTVSRLWAPVVRPAQARSLACTGYGGHLHSC